MPEGQIDDHSSGKILLSLALYSNSLVLVSDPWRAFEPTRCPSRALNLAMYVDSRTTEIQEYPHVCRVRHGGLRTLSRTTLFVCL